MEEKRETWINQDEITTVGILEIADTLAAIYVMFLTLLMPIDNLLQDRRLIQIPKKIFMVFFDINWYKKILANVLDKSNEMAILLITVPGATCYTLGYRIAVFTRFMFDVIYDEDLVDSLSDNNYF